MNIITLAHKRDMTHDFNLKHNMPNFGWKLNNMINKEKNLMSNFPRNWRYPINTKFDCYRNKIFYMEFLKEYVFYNINLGDVDEIIVKICSECSYSYIHSFKPLRLIFNVRIIGKEDNKTKNKVFRYTSIGKFLLLCRKKKKDQK